MIALGASLTRTPYGQHLQGPRKNKFKIHNSVNADDINKDETADIALVGDTALTISALIDEIKAQTGGKGAGDRAAVESEVAALKGLWLKEWCALQTTHPCASARAFCACEAFACCFESRTTTRLETARGQKQSRDDVLLSCAGTRCFTLTRSRSRTTA